MACDYTCHHFHWKLDEIHQLLTFVQNWIDWALHLLLEIDWRPNVHTNNRLEPELQFSLNFLQIGSLLGRIEDNIEIIPKRV